MRKLVFSLVGLLIGAAGAMAQQPKPGYAFLNANPKSAGPAVVVPAAATPPEPGVIGGAPVGGDWNPTGAFPLGPIQAAPGPMPMQGPMGPVPGMGPMYDPGMTYGPGFGGYGPGYPLDPPSSFGTERMWVTGRYLYGWVTKSHLSTPLVTVGSPSDPHPGGLGDPSTVIVYGDEQYRFGALNGASIEFGVNLNDRIYLELSAMVFAPAHTRATIASDASGNPFIGRPVFNTLFNEERSYLTSSPGLIAGNTQIEGKLQFFGFEGNARYNVNLTPYLSVDGLFGYRRLQMEEDLSIQDTLIPLTGSITFLGTPIGSPNTLSDLDRFAATNQFNGINTGMRFRWQSGFPWFAINGYGKVALGATRQTMEIEGLSGATTATGNLTTTGGVLALASNIGYHQRTVFGAVGEGGIGMVFLPAKHIRLHAGYSATYWNDVLRPGDHLDRRVNPALVPTDVNFGSGNPGAFPAFTYRSRSLVLQTINFGIELYY